VTQPPYPPQQPPAGQPQWGPPPGQPYPGAPYGPPQPPKKGLGAGAIVAIVLGSIVGLLLIVGIIGALADGGSTDNKATPKHTRSAAPAPAPAKSSDAPPAEEPAEKAPVTVTAKKTTFAPSVLHSGGAYTSVTVTISNQGDTEISVNPLYVTITDTDGSKHTAVLGMDENQIATVKLVPGEKVTGSITGKGKFTPAYVTYTDGLFGDGVRGAVH
jgi:cytoskeletal protein RodZ